MRALVLAAVLAAVIGLPADAQSPAIRPGKNTMKLRGQQEEIYYYPAPANVTDAPLVLFLPGDGGWRGDAVDMARTAAQDGYHVYGWDIKDYLEDFTGKTHLNESQMAEDIAAVAAWIRAAWTRGGPDRRVLLAGWSQGAGMVVLAGASAAHHALYGGVVGIGTPPSASLGWRFADNLSYVTKKPPDEPMFPLAPYLPQVAPLRYASIYATGDEEIPVATAWELFTAAREPKRAFSIEARGHDFGSNRADFYKALREALAWVAAR